MIPDYNVFTSYKSCTNEFVTLGDTTQLPIKGQGKAQFLLNGKVIEVRDALHVPDLRAPLYSLCRHHHMDGCGYYSQFGVGSFILFPTFTIQVNDTEDNIVSFKSIGRLPCATVHCKEPKTPTARPVHVIPIKNEMASVKFRSIVPKVGKQTPPPTPPTPESSPSPDSEAHVITDEKLMQSAKKPLTKRMLNAIHDDIKNLPEIPPSYTPGPAENTTEFDSLRVY
jgi:hypothetical protein